MCIPYHTPTPLFLESSRKKKRQKRSTATSSSGSSNSAEESMPRETKQKGKKEYYVHLKIKVSCLVLLYIALFLFCESQPLCFLFLTSCNPVAVKLAITVNNILKFVRVLISEAFEHLTDDEAEDFNLTYFGMNCKRITGMCV